MTEDQRRQDGCVMQEEGGGQKGNDYNGKVMRAISVHYGLSSDKNTERCKCQGGRWEAGRVGRKPGPETECPCPACHAFWELSMTISFLYTLSLLRWWSTEPCWARYARVIIAGTLIDPVWGVGSLTATLQCFWEESRAQGLVHILRLCHWLLLYSVSPMRWSATVEADGYLLSPLLSLAWCSECWCLVNI